MAICKNPDCNKRAYYNFADKKSPIYCKSHKLDGMIDVVSKKCCKCNLKQPNFNYPDKSKAIYCGECKMPDMIDVKHPKCFKCNLKIPNFNFANEKRPIYCGDCKMPNMIDIKSKKCFKCNLKHPIYNYPDEMKAIYCGDCKKPDMIDVVSKRCITCNLKIPYFNFANEKRPIYCGDCKMPNMIDIKSKRCITCNLKIPYFNFANEKRPIYCGDCKKPDMIDVKNKRCQTNLCEQFSIKDNYCMRCYYFHNPDKKPERLKVKEEEVIKYVKNNFKDIDMITDKCLIGDGLCLRTRPDILIHLNKHSIIIEIDENQHKFYNPICDEARINNIQEALNRPIIIIRFNPDAYTDKGINIKSCFKDNEKTGMKTIPKNKLDDWNNRLAVLKNTINDNLEYLNDEPIKLIKLFYDK
jgi:hypothetical protein